MASYQADLTVTLQAESARAARQTLEQIGGAEQVEIRTLTEITPQSTFERVSEKARDIAWGMEIEVTLQSDTAKPRFGQVHAQLKRYGQSRLDAWGEGTDAALENLEAQIDEQGARLKAEEARSDEIQRSMPAHLP